ncbi:MAG: aldehyde dehydrogenase family protein [Polaromonas sp.]
MPPPNALTATHEHARYLQPGHRLPGPGDWYAPTVFSNVNQSMEPMREESLGPLAGIQTFTRPKAWHLRQP